MVLLDILEDDRICEKNVYFMTLYQEPTAVNFKKSHAKVHVYLYHCIILKSPEDF